jgi:2-dehydro-3-deoxygluconokinase
MRVVTFGEAMLRLSPPADSSLEKAERFAVEIAGAEANVAIALARLGLESVWVSRLPRNALGRRVAASIREHGVDVSRVAWTNSGQVGLYFVELGAPPRPLRVIYDRQGSSFASITPNDVAPDILEGADLLHLTGITPALGASCRQTVGCFVQWALDRGMPISFDLNYRAKLWSAGEAREVLETMLPQVRFLFVSNGDASLVLGIDGPPEEQIEELGRRYPDATVVLTAGERGAWARDSWGSSGQGFRLYHRPAVPGVVVDRLGRGDAFCAGYLFGQLDQSGGPEHALACGTALASLAQTYAGDIAWITRDDVLALATERPEQRYR